MMMMLHDGDDDDDDEDEDEDGDKTNVMRRSRRIPESGWRNTQRYKNLDYVEDKNQH